MYRSDFRRALEAAIGDVSLDQVEGAIDKLIASKREKIADPVKTFLESINFWRMFMQHPLVGSTINVGNASKKCVRSDAYKRLRDKLNEILESQKVEDKDLLEIMRLLRKLRGTVIDFIEEQVGDVKQGLRHIHAPGSVSRKEALNLYFGERFTEADLYNLASRLCRSVAFGDSLGIYSEDKDFMSKLRQFVGVYGLGPPIKVEVDKLGVLDIQATDVGYPHVVFLKFIIWLREKIDVEEDPEKRRLCLSILDKLRVATIDIFFMPQDEREKWCTISIPRLDFFINNWIDRREAREGLRALIDSVNRLIGEARRESLRRGEFEKVRNAIDLLMNNYEVLCRRIIEYGAPDFHALRNMADIIADLSARYDISLSFRSLALMAGVELPRRAAS